MLRIPQRIFHKKNLNILKQFNYCLYSNVALAESSPEFEISKQTVDTSSLLAALKPREVVEQLNKFIVGQPDAKRAVAIALRNRWRRHQLGDDLKNEVTRNSRFC